MVLLGTWKLQVLLRREYSSRVQGLSFCPGSPTLSSATHDSFDSLCFPHVQNETQSSDDLAMSS